MLAGPTLSSTSPREALEARLLAHEERIVLQLSRYDRQTAIAWWIDTIRAVEELINLPVGDWDDDAFEHLLFEQPLSHFAERPETLALVHQRLTARFNELLANRVQKLIYLSVAIGTSFATHGLFEVAAGFANVSTLMGYFQSRRRHFVGLLHLMPSACTGRERISMADGLNVFLPIVELDGIQMMGAQNALIEKLSCERLGILDLNRVELKMLDSLYLEPERARITDMPWTDAGEALLSQREPQAADRLFSAAELRNDLVFLRSAYAEFDLDNTGFQTAAKLIDYLSRRCVDRDFWIYIKPRDLRLLFSQMKTPPALRAALVNETVTYMGCLSTYSPFVLHDGRYLSTVTLLSRFAYYWRGRTLNRDKRFQIRAGFIFEKAVASKLTEMGFEVQEITRVKRREFDVVTLRDGVIWNFQCKNNFVDLDRVEADAVHFARYNRLYVKSYEKAIDKEEQREHLLKERLSVSEIRHIVVSKFPVITDNPRILPFTRIEELEKRRS